VTKVQRVGKKTKVTISCKVKLLPKAAVKRARLMRGKRVVARGRTAKGLLSKRTLKKGKYTLVVVARRGGGRTTWTRYPVNLR